MAESAATTTTPSGTLDTTSATQLADSQATPQAADDKISPKLQILMRREKVALERERAAKAKEADVEKRYKEFEERENRVKEFESVKSTNPRRALELLGMSYQDLTQAELNDGQITPDFKIKQFENKFDTFIKTQQDALLRQQEEAQRLEEKRSSDTLEQFRGQIGTYIKENLGRYELIEFEQEHDLVYDLIDEHYNRTLKEAQEKAVAEGRDPSTEVGQVMQTAEAADKVELLLEQKYRKSRSLTKIQTLMAPDPSPPTTAQAGNQDKLKPPVSEPQRHTQKTLTNNMAPTQVSTQVRKGILTDEERIARAIAYAKGIRPTT